MLVIIFGPDTSADGSSSIFPFVFILFLTMPGPSHYCAAAVMLYLILFLCPTLFNYLCVECFMHLQAMFFFLGGGRYLAEENQSLKWCKY